VQLRNKAVNCKQLLLATCWKVCLHKNPLVSSHARRESTNYWVHTAICRAPPAALRFVCYSLRKHDYSEFRKPHYHRGQLADSRKILQATSLHYSVCRHKWWDINLKSATITPSNIYQSPFMIKPPSYYTLYSLCALTLWRRSLSKCYLRIQSVLQREHQTSPLHRSTF
jgi:hypothetical protein